jgi:hypothetical protein
LTAQNHTVSGTTRDPNRADLRSLGAKPVVVDVFDRDDLFTVADHRKVASKPPANVWSV